nr:hypothetical protein [Tanacetum cinerariifolium]
STNPKNNKDAHTDGKEHDNDVQKSVSSDFHSSSCGDQSKEQGDKAENKDKGKSPVVTITGFMDLNEEFAECINNSSNEVNAAGSSVFAAGLNFKNNTNDFSAAEELEIKVEYHRCSMKTFILACLHAFCHKRSPKESIKLSMIQVGLKPCKKRSFNLRCKKFGSW